MRRNVEYKKFPTSLIDNIPEWATYVEGRYPRFKVHDKIGTAKSAITTNGHGIIFRAFPSRQGQLVYKAVAVVNSVDLADHWYRKAKPDQLVNEVVLFKIDETPVAVLAA